MSELLDEFGPPEWVGQRVLQIMIMGPEYDIGLRTPRSFLDFS